MDEQSRDAGTVDTAEPGAAGSGTADGTGAPAPAYGSGAGAGGAAYGPGPYGQPGAYGQPGDGPPRPKRRVSRAVVAGIAAAAVVVAGGVGFAATRDGSGSTSQQAGPGGGFGGAGGPGGALAGGGPGGAGLGSIAHGEVVVADSSGAYPTRLVQTGTVSAVSASSITVRSADGYSATYTIGSGTSVDNGSDAVTDIATGHTVMVLASTGKAAVTITDQSLFTGGQGGAAANGQAGTGATP